MTTFRSEAGRAGEGRPPRFASPRAFLEPRKGTVILLALAASPAFAQNLALPSGFSATLFDVVLEASGAAMAPDAFTDPEALEEVEVDEDTPLNQPPAGAAGAAPVDATAEGIARFRLVVPGLGSEGAGYDAVAGDFLWLCREVALPALAANSWMPTEVVVALSDRETDFGVTDPDAVQFFEGFRISDGTCVPQAF